MENFKLKFFKEGSNELKRLKNDCFLLRIDLDIAMKLFKIKAKKVMFENCFEFSNNNKLDTFMDYWQNYIKIAEKQATD